jgi:hypothetical protein
MKNITLFVLSITVVVLCFLWLDGCEESNGLKLDLERIAAQDKRHAERIDSAGRALEAIQDRLDSATMALTDSKVEIKKAHRETAIVKRRYNEIKFIAYQTEIERDSILAVLYVSQPPDSVVMDSLIFETVRGRVCDTLSQRQADEILTLETTVLNGDRVIELQKAETASWQFLSGEWEDRFIGSEEARGKEKKLFREKVKRLIKIITAEGVIITVLVILLI